MHTAKVTGVVGSIWDGAILSRVDSLLCGVRVQVEQGVLWREDLCHEEQWIRNANSPL